MDNFWEKALKVGGSVTVVMFVIYGLFGKIIDKTSPLSAEYSLIILGFIIAVMFIIAGLIIDNRGKNEMDREIKNSIKDIENSDVDIKISPKSKIDDSIKNIKDSNIKVG